MSTFHFPRHDLIFCHVPKCGGSSIRNGAFGGRYEGPYWGRDWPEFLFSESICSFAFIREPVDRFLSACHHLGLNQREALDIVLDGSIDGVGPMVNSAQYAKHHLLPMVDPSHCLDRVLYVGRLANFRQDFTEIMNRAGVLIGGEDLPHYNSSRRRPETERPTVDGSGNLQTVEYKGVSEERIRLIDTGEERRFLSAYGEDVEFYKSFL